MRATAAQESDTTSARAETLTRSRERSAMPAITAGAEAGGRRKIGMVGAQTGAHRRDAALAGSRTGG